LSRNEIGSRPLVMVERATTILTILAESGTLGVTELARIAGIPKAAVFRIAHSLESRGFVNYDPSAEVYSIGVGLLDLADRARARERLGEIAYPCLAELADRTGETANLAVLRETQVLITRSLKPSRPYRIGTDLGPTAPLHCSAVGKVLLAYAPPEVLQRFLSSATLSQYTPNTITTRNAFQEELGRVKQRGWAIDAAELEEELYCIGAPVFASSDRAVAAVSISGPQSRLARRLVDLVDMVVESAQTISCLLGWNGGQGDNARSSGGSGKTPRRTGIAANREIG